MLIYESKVPNSNCLILPKQPRDRWPSIVFIVWNTCRVVGDIIIGCILSIALIFSSLFGYATRSSSSSDSDSDTTYDDIDPSKNYDPGSNDFERGGDLYIFIFTSTINSVVGSISIATSKMHISFYLIEGVIVGHLQGSFSVLIRGGPDASFGASGGPSARSGYYSSGSGYSGNDDGYSGRSNLSNFGYITTAGWAAWLAGTIVLIGAYIAFITIMCCYCLGLRGTRAYGGGVAPTPGAMAYAGQQQTMVYAQPQQPPPPYYSQPPPPYYQQPQPYQYQY